VVSNPVNYLCINDNGLEDNEVWDKQANFRGLVENIERRLLPEWNFRSPNSTTNAFSYGFSTTPWPSAFRISIAQPIIERLPV
jgi:hypothetical protein